MDELAGVHPAQQFAVLQEQLALVQKEGEKLVRLEERREKKRSDDPEEALAAAAAARARMTHRSGGCRSG